MQHISKFKSPKILFIKKCLTILLVVRTVSRYNIRELIFLYPLVLFFDRNKSFCRVFNTVS